MNDETSAYRDNVDTRLIIRQRLFLAIISVLIVISIINLAERKITLPLGISGFLLATAIGLALSRMFKIFWHQQKGKVISQLDTIGTIILVVYICIEICRTWIFDHWLSGAALNAFGLIVLTGLLLGRFLGTHMRIKNILSEKKIH